MIAQGIITGLAAAACQSLSYVLSRRFLARHGNNGVALFGLSHAITGVMALALLPFLWSGQLKNIPVYLCPLLAYTFTYLLGQFLLFQSFKHTDASRVSPLLGLKIPMLALITVLFLAEPITGFQWVAILATLGGSLALNYTGGRIPAKALLLILCTCFAYSLSDISIVELMRRLAPDGSLRMILLSTCLCYCVCGVVGITVVLFSGRKNRTAEKWRMAFPVGGVWFAGMLFLFISLWSVNVLMANIIQSLRGPFSIILGSIIAWLGHVHIERKVSAWVLVRRLVASFFMCCAIALFAHEKVRLTQEAKAGANAPSVVHPDDRDR